MQKRTKKDIRALKRIDLREQAFALQKLAGFAWKTLVYSRLLRCRIRVFIVEIVRMYHFLTSGNKSLFPVLCIIMEAHIKLHLKLLNTIECCDDPRGFRGGTLIGQPWLPRRTCDSLDFFFSQAFTEKTRILIPFKLNGIWSWWLISLQFWTKWKSIWFKIERKTVSTIISH